MSGLAQYESKLSELDFLPLLPEQQDVAEKIRQELTKNVKAQLCSYEAWEKIKEDRCS